MSVFFGPPGSGKIRSLVELAKKVGDGLIVTTSESRAVFIHSEAKRLGFDIRFPITYKDLLYSPIAHHSFAGLLFDDVDEFLRQLANGAEPLAMAFRAHIEGHILGSW